MDESAGLENRSTGNCTVGSNPTLSASYPLDRPPNPPRIGHKQEHSQFCPVFGSPAGNGGTIPARSTQVKDVRLSGMIR